MLYDTVLLRTFVAICDSGSFTKAKPSIAWAQIATPQSGSAHLTISISRRA
jgi:DNA-binding transcriptional LysR family regulator